MRIVVDFQGAQGGSRYRGIGRYTTAFTKALIRACVGRHEIIVALSAAFPEVVCEVRDEFSGLLPGENIRVWHPVLPTSYADVNDAPRRNASEYIREAFLASLRPDLIVVTSVVEGQGEPIITSVKRFIPDIPVAAILYDLIPLIYADEYLADKGVRSWYDEKLLHLRAADLLFSISESSRREGIKYLGRNETNIVNISSAIENNFETIAGVGLSELSQKFGIRKPYIMYSGASDPRKNLRRLIEAYAGIDVKIRDRFQMVFAGGMPLDHQQALSQFALSKGMPPQTLLLTGHISDDEMVGLYRNAFGYVFPSHHEGFGLPILEAMAFDIPVIGANRSSVPEVIGDPEALFDPFSVPEMRTLIRKLLTDGSYRDRLRKKARVHRKTFGWDATARRAIAEIERKFCSAAKPGMSKFNLLPPEMRLAQLSRAVGQCFSAAAASDDDLIAAASSVDRVFARTESSNCLFVDVSELARSDSSTGIQRVVRNILTKLLIKPRHGFRIVPVYASHEHGYREANDFICGFLGFPDLAQAADRPIDPRAGDIFLGLDYHDVLISRHRRFFTHLRVVGVKVFFVAYDLLPQQFPDKFLDGVTQNQRAWLRTVGGQADGVIAISKAVAAELQTWLRAFGPARNKPMQIGWFHLGSDFVEDAPSTGGSNDLTDRSSRMLNSIKSGKAFLLVSTIEPRKGHEQVLDAFDLLWRSGADVSLVLVGKKGWLVDPLVDRIQSHPEFDSRLFWMVSVDDGLLARLYDNCTCLIAASYGEGFGLPLVEAAQRGIPVLARDLPVFREVAGDGAYFFKGENAAQLSDDLQKWLDLYRRKLHPQPSRIKALSWDESAEQLQDVIFDGRWLSQVMPGKSFLFEATDERLGTMVGTRVNCSINSSQQEGYLVYGPHARLSPGNYEVRITGLIWSNPARRAYVEVVLEGGAVELGREYLRTQRSDGYLSVFSFSLKNVSNDLEVRVWVDALARISVDAVSFVKTVDQI